MSQTSLARSRQLFNAILFCVLLAPVCVASDWRYEESHTDSREFSSGGYVHVRLSVGDLHIKRGDSARIRLEYTVKSHRESHVKDARVDFNVRGNDATIEFHAPTSGSMQFDVELEVPANTNLDVHQKVGDLSVDSIEGDKDSIWGSATSAFPRNTPAIAWSMRAPGSAMSIAKAMAILAGGSARRLSTVVTANTNCVPTSASAISNSKADRRPIQGA